MKGVILSGGLGTRLRPLTHTGAKQLIPIANKPVLEYCIEQLIESGITEIGIIVGYTPERIQSIKDVIGDGTRWKIKITYIEQDAPRGISHAVYCAKEFVGSDPFIVFLGDNILNDKIAPFIKLFQDEEIDAGMFLSEEADPGKYGVAVIKDDVVAGVIEKPKIPPSNWVVIGIYYFSHRVFSMIAIQKPSVRGELEITDTLDMMIQSKYCRTAAAKIKGWWDDTGTSESILRANRLVLKNITIGVGTVISDNTVITSPVIIGKNCTITLSRIGPYTSIGDNCVICGGEIESSILVGDTIIAVEPKTKIKDSLIGRHTRIFSAKGSNKLILGENSEVEL
jgi:glucose-1-phosphate thymidylyltransferase